MIKKAYILFILLLSIVVVNAQENHKKDTVKLKEVTVSGNRIELPFSKESRTINVLKHTQISKMPATNAAYLLQSIPGIDIRRRGTDGMQSDLYIRGGNFEQTLLLIDGVKMSDPQTGHHIMNGVLPLMLMDQIEVLKGPAARIYGQNAFAGAINIVSKKVISDALKLNVNYGSYNNIKVEGAMMEKLSKGSLMGYAGYQTSDGYRYNTDFKNFNAFVKAELSQYTLMASFADRKFGANGFYASPKYKDQYEETTTSLVSLSSKYMVGDFVIKPRLYWRRNQDMYLFVRHNPALYRNMHISNKVGAEVNTVINSSFGKTGVGVDIVRTFLSSNNLGNHQRTSVTGFLEHRFEFLNQKLDVTPGVAFSYYSDFDTHVFPGLDVGYQLNKQVKIYANAGYTYRVPSFTDLYYKGRTNVGNPDLKPESALSEEIGVKYQYKNWLANVAFFHRNSDNLIDWTKEKEEDPWKSQNFSKVQTYGLEASTKYMFNGGYFHVNYTYIKDDIKENEKFALYSLNSMRHQLNTQLLYSIVPQLQHMISYRLVQRAQGEKYQLVDTKVSVDFAPKVSLFISINNLFNESYTETNLVPMPKATFMAGINYRIY